MIRDLAIYGAGGLGREIAEMVGQINADKKQWNVLGFFDDGKIAGEVVDGLPVMGGVNEVNHFKNSLSVIVAIADSFVRKAVVSKVVNDRIDFPVLFHPGANTGSSSNKIAKGCIITAGCILTTGITLHDFVIVNLSTTIGHDVNIGEFSSLMPSVNISGNVKISKHVFIGTGATILQGLKVGEGAVIGAGAVVTKDVPAGCVA
ncbi:MAG: acetyltransferase, partial [Cyclobacteriaceae bacterium]